MSTVITQAPSPDRYTLSSALPDAKAATGKRTAEVSLTYDPDGAVDVVYQAELSSWEGEVTVEGLADLCENAMYSRGVLSATFELRIDGQIAEFGVQYCEYTLPREVDLHSCFLTPSATAITHHTSAIAVAHIPDGSYDYTFQIVGLDNAGHVRMVEHTITRRPTTAGNSVVFEVVDIIGPASAPVGPLVRVARFAVTHGRARKVYYLIPCREYVSLRYTNMFGVMDIIDLSGDITMKIESSRKHAVCQGVAIPYDHKVVRTYELATSALTADQALDVEQLVASRNVWLRTPDEDWPVIITDHTLEFGHSPSAVPRTAKMSFYVNSARATILAAEAPGLMPSADGIFSGEYTEQFA